MPDKQRTPSMTWVRAFCEAGRHGSFKAAAESLHVAPSTVSHEIRKLEQWLGTPLFERTGQGIRLTSRGAALHAAVVVGFDHLDRAFERFQGQQHECLQLGMLPFVASEFVLPRSTQLEALIEGRAIALRSNNQLDQLSQTDPTERLDGVIRYARVAPPGYQAIELTRIRLGLVCGADREAISQRRVRNDRFDGWEVLARAGVELPGRAGDSIVVDNYLSGLRSVELGLGICIAVLPLSTTWLQQGRIRLWSPQLVEIPERYWLVFQPHSPRAEQLQAIGHWLQQAFAAEAATLERLLTSLRETG